MQTARAGVHASSFAAQCSATSLPCGQSWPADYFDTDALGLQMDGRHDRDILRAQHSAQSWWIGSSERARRQDGLESATSRPVRDERDEGRCLGRQTPLQAAAAGERSAEVDCLVGLQELGDSDDDQWYDAYDTSGKHDVCDESEHDGPMPAIIDCSDLSFATTVLGMSPRQSLSPQLVQDSPQGRGQQNSCGLDSNRGSGTLGQNSRPGFEPSISCTPCATWTESHVEDAPPRLDTSKGERHLKENINQIKIGLKKLRARLDGAPSTRRRSASEHPESIHTSEILGKMESESDVAPGLLVWIPPHMRGKGVSTIRGDLHRM